MTTQLRQRFGSTAPLFKSERMSSHVTDPETFMMHKLKKYLN
ncbi:hypothetical protein BIW11_04315 [Tropilaelaps mercedesae]|uniref:Uncharacterized protein n=1 Tax=Tropilaelaps mercedesae TaxID=418985 RepID=A0A1V9X8I4_9ACAR|nr:hypothetical protein BIW11_04315 [Tropilaelaps mercedesae]